MKNRRDVCAATEAGFAEYTGLPGVIKTGCQHSPSFQSKYCYEHSPRVVKMTYEDTEQPHPSQEDVVGFITNMKQTRNGVYYEVRQPANIISYSFVQQPLALKQNTGF